MARITSQSEADAIESEAVSLSKVKRLTIESEAVSDFWRSRSRD